MKPRSTLHSINNIIMPKELIICSCGCGREFKPLLRNGIIQSKLHPNCRLKKELDKAKKKQSNSEPKNRYSISKKSSKNFDFYKTTAWTWFSRYVLLYYADSNLVVQCATSGERKLITDKNMHCGHYIRVREGSKTHYAVALDFCNAGPQRSHDNVRLGGQQHLMRKWLISKHGESAVEDLEIRSHNICHPDKYWIDQMAKEYRLKFNNLLKERGLTKNPWYKYK